MTLREYRHVSPADEAPQRAIRKRRPQGTIGQRDHWKERIVADPADRTTKHRTFKAMA